MAKQNISALVRELFDHYNAHELDAVEGYFAKNSETVTIATGERSLGPDGARRDTERWFNAFPDLKFDLKNVIVGENAAVLEVRCTGTNNGPLVTPDGELPATGKRIDIPACIVLKFENGKVVSEHDYFDLLSLQSQLGVGQQRQQAAEQRAVT